MASPENNIIEVPVEAHGAQSEPNILAPDVTMVLLTWITFGILMAVLYKFAWKPILLGLEARENTIRRALDDAKKAKQELDGINAARAKMLSEADEKAKEIVDRSRNAATEAARVIERKAKEEAQILLQNATREIEAVKEEVQVRLRQDSVAIAVGLANKIIDANLDEAKQQKLIDKYIKEFKPE